MREVELDLRVSVWCLTLSREDGGSISTGCLVLGAASFWNIFSIWFLTADLASSNDFSRSIKWHWLPAGGDIVDVE